MAACCGSRGSGRNQRRLGTWQVLLVSAENHRPCVYRSRIADLLCICQLRPCRYGLRTLARRVHGFNDRLLAPHQVPEIHAAHVSNNSREGRTFADAPGSVTAAFHPKLPLGPDDQAAAAGTSYSAAAADSASMNSRICSSSITSGGSTRITLSPAATVSSPLVRR